MKRSELKLSYKTLVISSFYPEAIRPLYQSTPGLASASAQTQADTIYSTAFSWSDFPIKALRDSGLEAEGLIWGIEPYLDALREELGTESSPIGVLVEAIKKINPDVILIQGPLGFDAAALKSLKTELPRVRGWLGFQCSPFQHRHVELLRSFDLLFSCTPGFVDQFRASGMKAELLQHVFPKSLLERVSPLPYLDRKTPFGFSGSIIPRPGFHENRLLQIQQILNSGLDLKVFSSPNWQTPDWKGFLKQVVIRGFEMSRELWPESSLKSGLGEKFSHMSASRLPEAVLKQLLPPRFGIGMFEILGNTQICLNVHGEITGQWAGNIRMFEATGMGTCLLTDEKVNNRELFEPDFEMVTYRTVEECISKAKWLVENPKEAAKIAERGQMRCLKDHTYEAWAGRFSEQVNQHILRN
jgi:hypothetical protein